MTPQPIEQQEEALDEAAREPRAMIQVLLDEALDLLMQSRARPVCNGR